MARFLLYIIVLVFATSGESLHLKQLFLNGENQTRLLQTAENEAPFWGNPLELIQKRIKFFDITNHQNDLTLLAPAKKFPIPKSASHQDEVLKIASLLDTSNMRTELETFTAFNNRYYQSTTGKDSADWLFSTLSVIAKGSELNIAIRKFEHSWTQFSIIARIEGIKENHDEVVVVGAHQDSISGYFFPANSRAPGADDDGSGTITIVEAFRSIILSKFQPERSIEFHWYSGEEAGLLGSQDIATAYRNENRPIVGMLHFDMTGYRGKDNVFGIVTDYVDPELTDFLKGLAEAYSSIPVALTVCGYACSDHASFTKAGYRSALPFESTFNDKSPYIHTKNDLVKYIDFDHMKEFSKVAVGYIVELSYV